MKRIVLLITVLSLLAFPMQASIAPGVSGSDVSSGLLDQQDGLPRISTYPNPFQNELVVELQDLEGSAQLKLFNLVGNIQLQQQVEAGSVRLDVSDLPSGTYYLRIETGSQTLVRRVVKY